MFAHQEAANDISWAIRLGIALKLVIENLFPSTPESKRAVVLSQPLGVI